MLTLRKYEKHIRTLIDELIHSYFYFLKDIGMFELVQDYTVFSGNVMKTLDYSDDILDFCDAIRNSLNAIKPYESQKEKILLKKLENLYEYEIYARKELN